MFRFSAFSDLAFSSAERVSHIFDPRIGICPGTLWVLEDVPLLEIEDRLPLIDPLPDSHRVPVLDRLVFWKLKKKKSNTKRMYYMYFFFSNVNTLAGPRMEVSSTPWSSIPP